ncbi:hypothetical protein SEA_PUPPER_103 [Gordonia phage Pupper]|uniref:Uncharacterized protein n=1 Tax=Gordonia phage Pupper TaxID=2571249 RepID=A0A4Y6ES57_9CAUD|nr:hypothetical protein KHQ83_gp174 [Gordonia phage Pupper]QDF18589.1 hypothetical protein SEA_PUPPER_103 [Gordonia phage Pupper]
MDPIADNFGLRYRPGGNPALDAAAEAYVRWAGRLDDSKVDHLNAALIDAVGKAGLGKHDDAWDAANALQDHTRRMASRWDEYEDEFDPYNHDDDWKEEPEPDAADAWLSQHDHSQNSDDSYSNPDSENYLYERPKTQWQQGPGGEKSTDLWRAVNIPVDHPKYAGHPDLEKAKGILYGDNYGEGNLHPHPSTPEGQAVGHHLLNFMEDVGRNVHKYREDYSSENERTRIPFTKTKDTGDPTNLGRHWSTDPGATQVFSYPWDKNSGRFLSVMMNAGWNGEGEDMNRTNSGGSFAHEKEVTLSPGAPLSIKGLHIKHPHEWNIGDDIETFKPEQWHNVIGEPQKRSASLGDFRHLAPSR